LLAGYVMRVADADRTPCLFLDEVHWGDLAAEARVELLKRFLMRAASTARLVAAPILGYADLAPFTVCGFRRSPRRLRAYLTRFNSSPLSELGAFYLDVI